MILYFAGAESYGKGLETRTDTNELFSYYRLPENKVQYMRERPCKTFLDSGGYSAMSVGADIDIDVYIDFLQKNKDGIDYYAQLDVIGDEQATKKNLEYMESKGLEPLPVFHYGSNYKRLEELIEKYEYICLGGLVPLAKKQSILYNHLDRCFSIAKDKVKIHGFGMTGIPVLKRYPFYSVDSTAWLEATRRGTYYEWKNGDMHGVSTSNKKEATIKSIRFSGKGEDGKLWRRRCVHAIEEWKKCETYITKLWEKKGIKWG